MNNLYAFYRPNASVPDATKEFTLRYGYSPSECISGNVIMRLGPIYNTRAALAGEVRAGDILLVAGQWATAEDVDGPNVLTSSGDIITLGDSVTVRRSLK